MSSKDRIQTPNHKLHPNFILTLLFTQERVESFGKFEENSSKIEGKAGKLPHAWVFNGLKESN